MKYFKINAFVPLLSLPKVEKALKDISVPGITVSKVKGYGTHMNFFSADWLETHGRIEIFCDHSDAQRICQCINDVVDSSDAQSKGFIAILPVDNMFCLGEPLSADCTKHS